MDYADFVMHVQRAEKGDVNSQSLLAAMYASGDGVDKDVEKAFFWYKKAAKRSSDAQYNVALMMLLGEVDVGSAEEAIGALRLASRRGSGDASLAIGKCYELGLYGVRVNPKMAAKYYLISIWQGSVLGSGRISSLLSEKKLNGKSLASVFSNAYKWISSYQRI